MSSPTYGVVAGHEVHAKTRDHLAKHIRFSPSAIRQGMKEVEGFNAKLAVLITSGVGTMACAYLFCVIALVSLPAVLVQAEIFPASTFPSILVKPSTIALVAWIAQTFIQLVLLSIIMVGQRVQSAASDARAAKTFDDAERLLGLMDAHTDEGLGDLMKAIEPLLPLIKSIDTRLAANGKPTTTS